jgi:hypothetical protein
VLGTNKIEPDLGTGRDEHRAAAAPTAHDLDA